MAASSSVSELATAATALYPEGCGITAPELHLSRLEDAFVVDWGQRLGEGSNGNVVLCRSRSTAKVRTFPLPLSPSLPHSLFCMRTDLTNENREKREGTCSHEKNNKPSPTHFSLLSETLSSPLCSTVGRLSWKESALKRATRNSITTTDSLLISCLLPFSSLLSLLSPLSSVAL